MEWAKLQPSAQARGILRKYKFNVSLLTLSVESRVNCCFIKDGCFFCSNFVSVLQFFLSHFAAPFVSLTCYCFNSDKDWGLLKVRIAIFGKEMKI